MNFEKIFSNIFKFVDDISVINTREKFEAKVNATGEAFNEIFPFETANCDVVSVTEEKGHWEAIVVIFCEDYTPVSFTFSEAKPHWMNE